MQPFSWIVRVLGRVAVGVAACAPSAQAQPPAEPVPDDATPTPAPAATTTGAPVAPTYDAAALTALIDARVDQRVAERLRSGADQMNQRKETAGWKDGFFIQTSDGTTKLKIGGFQQFDGRFFLSDEEEPRADQFGFRSIRPDLQGTLFDRYDFRLMTDFAGGRLALQDAYVDVRLGDSIKVRAGKFKVAFGLERFQGETNTLFAERGLPTQLVPNRDLGVQIHGELAKGAFAYQIGVFNGVVDGGSGDGDVSDGKEGALRIFVKPFATTGTKALKELGVGGAVTAGSKEGVLATPDVGAFRTPSNTTFFSFATGATLIDTVIADGTTWRATGQASYYVGPVGLLGEYVRTNQKVTRGDVTVDASFDSWQAVAQYVLTGDDATFKGVAPKNPFDPATGQWGAFDVGARIGQFRVVDSAIFREGLADGQKSALRVWSAGAGVNWYANKNIRLVLDFERTWFRYGATDGTTTVDRAPESSIVGRVQTVF
ncbi:MAG: OprO/OprP family phosphate-selective porin [Kofleriaceae bacterium]